MDELTLKEKVEELVNALTEVYQVLGMYSRSNIVAKRSEEKLLGVLECILSGEAEVTLGVKDDGIYFKEDKISVGNDIVEGFSVHLMKTGISAVVFQKGVTRNEISDLVSVISMSPEVLNKGGGISRKKEMNGLEHIIVEGDAFKGSDNENDGIIKFGDNIFNEGHEVFRQIKKDLSSGRDINMEMISKFVSDVVYSLVTNKTTLLILSAVKGHEGRYYIHNINVAIFSILQAEALGLESEYMNEIGVAGLLHDLGKFLIPTELLDKNKALTEGEFYIIKAHTINGAKTILKSSIEGLLPAIVAFEHHLKCDQSGYPERIFPSNLNLASKLVAIADVYDALRSKRSYAGEIAPEKTYDEMMKLGGKNFDEDLLDNFFRIVGIYPPGTIVRIDTGEIALVLNSSIVNKMRPQVELLYDEKGQRIKTPEIVNLLDKEGGKYKRTIVHSIIPTENLDVPEKYKG